MCLFQGWHKSSAAQGWQLWFVGGSQQGLTPLALGLAVPESWPEQGFGVFLGSTPSHHIHPWSSH